MIEEEPKLFQAYTKTIINNGGGKSITLNLDAPSVLLVPVVFLIVL